MLTAPFIEPTTRPNKVRSVTGRTTVRTATVRRSDGKSCANDILIQLKHSDLILTRVVFESDR
jgi:hypothetical protein